MTSNTTMPNADEGRLERGVGWPAPGRAEDRTLLALAAAAANIPCKGWCQPGARTDGWHGMYTGSDDDGAYVRWNPLTDDGDALRLAVALGIRCEPMAGWCVAYAGSVCAQQFSERSGDNIQAAMRRAIVRAAAALGASKTPNVRANLTKGAADEA